MSNEKIKSRSHLVAGFTGGLTSAVILQPFDLLKTRIQQSQNINSSLINNTKSVKLIIKEMPSLLNLWKGTLPSVLRTSIGSSLYLTSLQISRNYLANKRHSNTKNHSSNLPKLKMYENLISGGLMRGMVGFITMPMTVIKTRYESSIYNYNSMFEAIKSIYNERGVKGFFLGSGSTIVRDAPYAGLYVLLYEQLKSVGSNINLNENYYFKGIDLNSIMINSVSAMSAAGIATIITTPFDTIKTRIQINPEKYKNFYKTGKMILKIEGFNSLFSGASLRCIRKTLSAGIAWGVYEELLKLF